MLLRSRHAQYGRSDPNPSELKKQAIYVVDFTKSCIQPHESTHHPQLYKTKGVRTCPQSSSPPETSSILGWGSVHVGNGTALVGA